MADIILKIICYTEINKKNEKNTADNVNALAVGTQQEQTLCKTCTN